MTHRPPLLVTLNLLVAIAVLATGCGDSDGGTVVSRSVPPIDGARTDTSSSDPGIPVPDGADGGLLVDVAGSVRRPGVYRLAAGARVHEAIAAAGGARRGAQLGALNRAALLVDGQQVIVLGADNGNGAPGGAVADAATISINNADASALDALPGIGPVTAERIVAERTSGGPFASIDELDRVPGVGPATVEALRDVATT